MLRFLFDTARLFAEAQRQKKRRLLLRRLDINLKAIGSALHEHNNELQSDIEEFIEQLDREAQAAHYARAK